MNLHWILPFSVTMGMVSCGLIGKWYLWPALTSVSRVRALTPLLLLHSFRYIGLAFLIFTMGMQRITVAQASILVLLEPLLNPVWVYLAIGELPSGYGFSGYGLILSGILADQWLRLRLPGVQRPGGSVDVTARGPG